MIGENRNRACSWWYVRMSRILHRALYLHIVMAHEDVIFLVFSHPDYTVGSGTSPDPASPYKEWLAGSTADQELRRQCLLSPCPEDIAVFNYDAPMIAYSEGNCLGQILQTQGDVKVPERKQKSHSLLE